MSKVGMISLGCPKNQVDSEIMLKKLEDAGFITTPREDDAEAIIINTCGFIEAAAGEAIETILEIATYKKAGALKALIVTGCLAERYKENILEEIPEVDVCVGLGSEKDIENIVKEALKGKKSNYFGNKLDLPLEGGRKLTTPPYSAYIKIAEGCSNGCSYCAIPLIRGKMRSRTVESILAEAEALAKSGVKELIVVAQDTTAYGTDLYGKPMLSDLLKKLTEIDGLMFIRTLYTYPDKITDDLIKTVKQEPKLCKYFDIPIQHISDKILKSMRRTATEKDIRGIIEKIRKEIPNVTLRTSLITGYPGETEEDFIKLCEFVKEIRFDRLGCFPYSQEDGTLAAKMPNQIDEKVKVYRAENIMNEQSVIMETLNREKIGKTYTVLTEGYDGYIKAYFGRSECDAPEIDGKIFFKSNNKLMPGDTVKVKINDCLEYDLLGEEEE